MVFEKVESVCPHCRKANTIEVGRVTGAMTKITCKFCSKGWSEDLQATSKMAKSALFKSAPASPSPAELSALRTQVLAQFEELSGILNGIIAKREAAARRFNPNGVEKSDVADAELRKARANSAPVIPAPGFRPQSATGVDAAAWDELGKALDNPRRGMGGFNPFKGEKTGPRFQPQEALKVVAAGSPELAGDEGGVSKSSKFEPRG